jgi:hypothetical protein
MIGWANLDIKMPAWKNAGIFMSLFHAFDQEMPSNHLAMTVLSCMLRKIWPTDQSNPWIKIPHYSTAIKAD